MGVGALVGVFMGWFVAAVLAAQGTGSGTDPAFLL
jgi:hypothetical protein